MLAFVLGSGSGPVSSVLDKRVNRDFASTSMLNLLARIVLMRAGFNSKERVQGWLESQFAATRFS
jgi:hypothetical protein